MLKPTQPVPPLSLDLVGGGRFDLAAATPASFTMMVVYRGYHCPICRTWLGALAERMEDFRALGVEPVAVSTDGAERATKSREEWGLSAVPVAYGLSIDDARAWGLAISSAVSDKEPPLFAEPGVFLVRPDATLYAAAVQTMPFARPSVADLLGAVKFIGQRGYPPRGTA